MGTVSDFKKFVCDVAGLGDPYEMTQWSNAHLLFYNKLNKLGARNIKTHPPEEYPDIDATVELSQSEWLDLLMEFRELLKQRPRLR